MRQGKRETPLKLLSAAFVKTAPEGKHCDGGGLWLYRGSKHACKWILRYHLQGKRREMGLGTYPSVSLLEAREAADKWRKTVDAGIDPLRAIAAEERAQSQADVSLSILTTQAFEARKAELKGDGMAGRWMSPLDGHILPKLGSLPVTGINQRDIHDALSPIWHTKADVARKALNRLGIVLRHAAALGLEVDLQATAKAKALLGKSRHKAKNIPAMAWQEVPGFYKTIQEPSVANLALRLLILTGARQGSLRAIRLEQIEGDVWTIPAEKMKGRKDATNEFRVPLSREALTVIELAKAHERNGLLFPNQSGRACITDVTVTAILKRQGLEARLHGFRTSLRV